MDLRVKEGWYQLKLFLTSIPLHKISDKVLDTQASRILGNLLLINGPDDKYVHSSLEELKKYASDDTDKTDIHLDVSFAEEVKGRLGVTAGSILKHGDWLEEVVRKHDRKREKDNNKKREDGLQVSEQKHETEFAKALKEINEISCDSSQSGKRWALSDFFFISFIGKGSYGSVLKVCLKKFPEFHFALKIEECSSKSFYDYFSRFLIFASRLEHPNILPIIGFFSVTQQKKKSDNFLMATVTPLGNESLEHRLRVIGKAQEMANDDVGEEDSFDYIDFSVDVGVSLMEGVRVMHEEGIIHRDLKPDNILLFAEEDTPIIKIADLGFVRELPDEFATHKATVCGTKGYMAPEVENETETYTEKADLYSCGIIFLEVRLKPEKVSFMLLVNIHSQQNFR